MNSSRARMTKLHPFLSTVVLILPLLVAGSLPAQETLLSIAQQEGVEWIVGKWTGTNSEGRSVALEYEWELDGHALEIDLTMGAESYKGMIALQPTDSRAVEFGADSSGGVTRATWRVQDGLVISDRTGTRSDGREIKIAVVNKKVDADTVIATVHSYAANGELSTEVLDTVTLKRVSAADTED